MSNEESYEKRVEEYKKKSRPIFLFTIIGGAMIIGSYLLFATNQVALDDKIEEVTVQNDTLAKQNQELIEQKQILEDENWELTDSIIKLHGKITSATETIEENNQIVAVVSDYFKYRNLHQTDSVVALLADKLEKFYLMNNITRDQAEKDFRKYWKENPNSRYSINLKNFVVNKLSNGRYEVVLSASYTKDGQTNEEVLTTIRLDANRKIYYAQDKKVG